MIHLEPTTLQSLKPLREAYQNELQLSQELYLEWLIINGSCFNIYRNEKQVGYCITVEESTLAEFYLTSDAINCKETILKQAVTTLSITHAYCKSFDHMLLASCNVLSKSSKVFGLLFRNYTTDLPVAFDSDIAVRLAVENDIPFLLTQEDGLYETPEELKGVVSRSELYLFHKDKQLGGCGFLIRITEGRSYYDIGMWTNLRFRQKGYASMIISYLKQLCLANGYTPVAGCAADNTASRKTLEKNGFLTQYCLLKFKF